MQTCARNRDNVSKQRSTLVLRPCTNRPEKRELESERSRRLKRLSSRLNRTASELSRKLKKLSRMRNWQGCKLSRRLAVSLRNKQEWRRRRWRLGWHKLNRTARPKPRRC